MSPVPPPAHPPTVSEGASAGAGRGPGAALAVVTMAATLFATLALAIGVTASTLPASLTGIAILAGVALALHRSTGGRAALVVGIVPWGMALPMAIPAYVEATSTVNLRIPREGTGIILFAFVFLVAGAVGMAISITLGVFAWRKPREFARVVGPIAAVVALANLALGAAGGAQLARHPDAAGYGATLPQGDLVTATDLLGADFHASIDDPPMGPGCQARWDAAHGVWALVDRGQVVGFVRPAKKGELASMYPSELGLAPPAAWVWPALLGGVLFVAAVGAAAWAARGRKGEAKGAVSAALVAAAGASAITGCALSLYRVWLAP